MSIDIRYVTNGVKTVYRVIDSKNETFSVYKKREDIPISIRHYAPDEDEIPMHVEPDFARMLGVKDILYPNFPNCTHPEFIGTPCIAEACSIPGYKSYTGCPYFDQRYKNEALEDNE